MKINRYYWLRKTFLGRVKPSRIGVSYSGPVGKREFDSCTIVHYLDPKWRPIVLTEDMVVSSQTHKPSVFYKAICRFLKDFDFINGRFGGFLAVGRGDRIKWGCRWFTRSQLKTIKKAMEFHYPKEKLKR